MRKNNIITGIPRSGTSLISSLIAENQRSVVFSEPEWLKTIRQSNHSSNEFTTGLINKIELLRSDIKQQKQLKLKIDKNNQITSNYYQRDQNGHVITVKNEEAVTVQAKYAEFPFYIKSNAQFTSCLKDLINSKAFNIYCIIRNPISCIMSWRSLNIPVSNGNMKIAEKYSDSYLSFTSGSNHLLHKQVLIIEWFYKEFIEHLDSIEIIQYESLLSDTGLIIGKITGNDNPQFDKLKSANNNKHYNHREKQKIKDCLKAYGKFYRHFYPNLDAY